MHETDDGLEILSPPLLNLSAENLSRAGIYLMDHGKVLWHHKDWKVMYCKIFPLFCLLWSCLSTNSLN